MNGTASIAAVVIAPTYNNAATLPGILQRVEQQGLPLIVVNDGSTDQTPRILADLIVKGRAVSVVTHVANRGKAAALRSGFVAARQAGYTHAATIDTDGQLDPEQIPQLLSVARQHPNALVLGVRADTQIGYPPHRHWGRRLCSHLLWLESGVRVSDSQCGLRVYPLGLMETIPCLAGRFGFETEIIARAGWAACPIHIVPVNCRYLPPAARANHFGGIRAAFMHVRLLFRALAPWPHRRWPQRAATEESGPLWRRVGAWFSPLQAWRHLRRDEAQRTAFATGLALGVFIANLPLYGLQTVLSLYAARRLHLHPISVVAGSQVSTPPLGWAMIAVAICVGHLLLHGSQPALAGLELSAASLAAAAPGLLLDWIVGAIPVGLAMSAATFGAALTLLRMIPPSSGRPAQETLDALHASGIARHADQFTQRDDLQSPSA